MNDLDLPQTFISPSSGAQEEADRWWQLFGDAKLNALVDDALVNNRELAQGIARVRIAEAQARVSGADAMPQVAVGVASGRQRQNMAVPGASTDALLVSSHRATVDVSWEMDLWSRLSLATGAARADYLATQEDLRAVQQAVAAEVVRSYLSIAHERAQLDLSQRTIRSLEGTASQIANRTRAGVASPTDAALADANLQSAKAGMEQRHEALERSVRQFELLLGRYPTGTLSTALALPDVPTQPAVGVPADLLARRPDVRAAELMLEAAGYRREATRRSFLPALSLTGSLGYGGAELSGLFSRSNLVWSIAGQLLQPVFQGGRLQAQRDLAHAQRDERVHLYAQTALTALGEVETALAIHAVLKRRTLALESAASSAERAVRVSTNRYLQGIDPFLNVLESQQRALDSRSAQITAHHQQLDNQVSLHLALGGGFENDTTTQARGTFE